MSLRNWLASVIETSERTERATTDEPEVEPKVIDYDADVIVWQFAEWWDNYQIREFMDEFPDEEWLADINIGIPSSVDVNVYEDTPEHSFYWRFDNWTQEDIDEFKKVMEKQDFDAEQYYAKGPVNTGYETSSSHERRS